MCVHCVHFVCTLFSSADEYVYAWCEMEPNNATQFESTHNVTGMINIKQWVRLELYIYVLQNLPSLVCFVTDFV